MVFATLVANAGSTDGAPAPGGGVSISTVTQSDAPAERPADLSMPLGLIGFEAALGQVRL